MAFTQLLWRLHDGRTATDCELCEAGREWLLVVTYRGKRLFRARYRSRGDAEQHAAVLRKNLLANAWRAIPPVMQDSAPRARPLVLFMAADSSTGDRYRQHLEHVGFAVETTSTVADGLRTAQQRVPDVIVVDHAVTDVSAAEVLSRLRADASTARVPVIALCRGEHELMSGGSAGFDHVLRESDAHSIAHGIARLITMGA
jgi:CheY-like chemotaxis protein